MKEKEEYPHYTKGDELPEGLYPPIDGYTHEALIDIAGQKNYETLISLGVEHQLAQETVFSMAAYVNEIYEQEFVEYMLSRYVLQPNVDIKDKKESIDNMANHYATLTVDAQIEAVAESPLINMFERKELVKLVHASGDIIFNLIMELKNYSPPSTN